MIKRSFAGLLAGICVISASAPCVNSYVSNAEDENYTMNVSVKLDGTRKEISPYIYGVNEFGNAENLKNVTVNNVRQGGNRYTGYNWETNWSNAGEDWLHSSDTNIGDDTDGAGYAPRKLSETCQKYNIPYRITTLQMAGYVSADKDGSVKENEIAPSDRWKKVAFRKDGELSLTPDTTDDTVYMDEYVNYIVNTLGDAKSETGIQGYSLDNEPVLWNDTHPRLHPEEVTNSELVSKSIELAKVVKEIDPNAEVFGPAFWGMLPCMQIGENGNGFTDPDWQSVKSNYFWYLDYYLDQMAKAGEEAGTRLLDVVDVHYYAQANNFNDDAILQAARSLYDPTYAEDSWLQPWGGQYFPFITNIKKSIDKYYPGTKIAISEYNLGNIADEKNTGKSVVSGIAEAEALGCFADNDVYFATYWGTLPECPYVASAINLYTNYDGEGAAFGDTLVEAGTEDLSLATAYAAINGDDDTQVNLVLSNKDKTRTENAVIDLSGTSTEYKSAVVYAITQDNSDIHIISVDNSVSGNKVSVELPPLSVAQIVLSDKESDKEEYVAPDVTTKEVTFSFSELEKSANGYPMIPIEDAKALKKAVINSTASCTSNSSWYGGGGGLCFNKLKLADGSISWGQKSFMYGGGTQDNTVTFDGTFNIPVAGTDKSEVLDAEIGDTYMEFQDWWKSSADDETGADVSVTYNTITLYYEYEGSAPDDKPTDDDKTVWGDANVDGNVTISDAVSILQSITNAEKYPLSAQGAKNADVYNNGDGITGKDASVIQLVDAGALKLEELPVKGE
ncbi:MAG: glycoside hydrolase [Ruminococcus sp.]|nr:glycoside hydrolase [Ruminococcus sp.]